MVDITDDLGQVEYLFTEKNGILVQNSFVARKLLIKNDEYKIRLPEVYKPSGKSGAPALATSFRCHSSQASKSYDEEDELHSKTFLQDSNHDLASEKPPQKDDLHIALETMSN
jgi:magnesium-transporting ATPase (P-type)